MTISGSGFFSSNFVNSKVKTLQMSLASESEGSFAGISRKFCMPSSNVPRHDLAVLTALILRTRNSATHHLCCILTVVYAHQEMLTSFYDHTVFQALCQGYKLMRQCLSSLVVAKKSINTNSYRPGASNELLLAQAQMAQLNFELPKTGSRTSQP
jgi:hypothetical protein